MAHPRRRKDGAITIPFSAMDEMFLHLDEPTRPLVVHVEVRLGGAVDEARLRDAIRDAAERVKPEAVESYLEVRQLNGANGVGYYFAATDRDPGPGEFKFMNQGALQVGTLTLWFTILANDGEDTVAVEALAMLQAATHRRTGLDQL